MPRQWIDGLPVGSDESQAQAAREAYLAQHDLHGVPEIMSTLLVVPLGFQVRYCELAIRTNDRDE